MAIVRFNERKDTGLTSPVFNDIFENFFNDAFLSDRIVSRVPAVNISETDNHYHIELAAPGLKKEDFKIDVDRNVLTISAEKQTENTENNDSRKYNKREYSYTSFARSFTLPESADDASIEAAYTDGVLKIDVAKKEEAKAISRHIEIK